MAINYYFDSINGNDENNGLSSDEPLKTLDTFLSQIIYTTDETILNLGNGTYSITNVNWISRLTAGKKVIFTGKCKLTVLEMQTGWFSNAGGGQSDSEIEFRKMKFTTNGRMWTNAFCVRNTLYFNNIYFYNFGTPSYSTFITTSNSKYYFTNCISTTNIALRNTGGWGYTATGNIYVTNSYGYFTCGYNTYQSSWDITNNILTSSPQLDDSFNPIGYKNIGVNYGLYSWINFLLQSKSGKYYTIENNKIVEVKNLETAGFSDLNLIFDVDKKSIQTLLPFKIIMLNNKKQIVLSNKKNDSLLQIEINNNIFLIFKARFLLSDDMIKWYNYYDENTYDTITFKTNKIEEKIEYIFNNCKYINKVNRKFKYALFMFEDMVNNKIIYKNRYSNYIDDSHNYIFKTNKDLIKVVPKINRKKILIMRIPCNNKNLINSLEAVDDEQ